MILIVDDEPLLRETVALALADDGYRVTCAADGREALALLERVRPAIIVSDVTMPRMGGVALVRSLRERDDGTPVVLVSAVCAAVDLPGVVFLAKPFDLDDLAAAITRGLAGRVA